MATLGYPKQPIQKSTNMIEQRTNWAGNFTFSASQIHYPSTIKEVQELVRRAGKLKVLGAGHSFNEIADSSEEQISLANFQPVLVIDRERQTVTVNAGAKYGQICEELNRQGYALPNLASLPHISVAGACATATHGSGDHNGNLATAVAAMELVTGDGEVVVLSRDQQPEQFSGAVVGLGGVGVVTQITLDIVPTFNMRQYVYEDLPLAQFEEHFDEITSSAYSVSLFTDWHKQEFQQVWLKYQETGDTTFELKSELYGAKLATSNHTPIRGGSVEACNPQLGIVGPWYERLPHFQMAFTPSSGEELQTEYLVPRQHALAAIKVIDQLRDKIAPLLQVCEIRTIAADNLWMSPCYQQARVGVHFTWIKNWEAVRQLLPLIEAEFEALKAIPHWGKLFTMSGSKLQPLYPKLADFQNLLHSFDPHGKFRNAFLDKYIYATEIFE